MTDTEWSNAQSWLATTANHEYLAQRAHHVKRGRSARTFRYSPPSWHRDCVNALGADDIESFKANRIAVILHEVDTTEGAPR